MLKKTKATARKRSKNERKLGWKDSAIVLLTGVLVVLGFMQWQHSREALHKIERPWIQVPRVEGRILLEEPIPAGITFTIQNAGKGSALDLRIGGGIYTICDPAHQTRETFPAPFLESDLEASRANVARKPPMRHPLLAAGTEAQFFHGFDKGFNATNPVILGKQQTLYFYGEVQYRDDFGSEHKTTFCYYFDPDRGEWHGSDRGNSAN